MIPNDFLTFLNAHEVRELGPFSIVQDVESAAALIPSIHHWFDQQRAAFYVSNRVDVDVNLIFRMMRGGIVK